MRMQREWLILRASGFKVFVEKTADDVEEYFVMIGPKLSKERILMVKKTLQKNLKSKLRYSDMYMRIKCNDNGIDFNYCYS